MSKQVPDGYGFDALIEAFTIFRKYGNPRWPTNCSHDQLSVEADRSVMTQQDVERLEELGFSPDDELGPCFTSSRFGSN